MKEEFNICPFCGTALDKDFIEGKDRKFCPSCKFIDYKNPLPVALAIPVRNKKFLMIKRGIPPRQGAWGFPSGFIESGETAEEACLREMKEEAGLSGKIVRLVGVHRINDPEIHGDMLVVMYLVAADEGEPRPGPEEQDARFFNADEMPEFYTGRFKHLIDEIQN